MAEMKYAPEAMYDGTREREGKGERKTIAVLQFAIANCKIWRL